MTAGPALGSLAWVMTARGGMHRAICIGLDDAARPRWALCCDQARERIDPRIKVLEARPRRALMCSRCRRVLRAGRPAHPRQLGLGEGFDDGRE
jgi:hypothetical protein